MTYLTLIDFIKINIFDLLKLMSHDRNLKKQVITQLKIFYYE